MSGSDLLHFHTCISISAKVFFVVVDFTAASIDMAQREVEKAASACPGNSAASAGVCPTSLRAASVSGGETTACVQGKMKSASDVPLELALTLKMVCLQNRILFLSISRQ